MAQKQSTELKIEKPKATIEMYLRTSLLVLSWVTLVRSSQTNQLTCLFHLFL